MNRLHLPTSPWHRMQLATAVEPAAYPFRTDNWSQITRAE